MNYKFDVNLRYISYACLSLETEYLRQMPLDAPKPTTAPNIPIDVRQTIEQVYKSKGGSTRQRR